MCHWHVMRSHDRGVGAPLLYFSSPLPYEQLPVNTRSPIHSSIQLTSYIGKYISMRTALLTFYIFKYNPKIQ